MQPILLQHHEKIESIKPVLLQALKKFFYNSYYDRTVYYLETSYNPLVQPDPNLYQFDPLAIVIKYGTADCVGLALKFIDDLSNYCKLQLIPASTPLERYQSHMPKCTHPGLLLWCQDGYILLDPTMNIPFPIIFQQNLITDLNLGVRGKWRYILDLPNQQIQVLKNIKLGSNFNHPTSSYKNFSYYLKPVINPIQDLLIPHFIFDRNVLISSFNYPHESYYLMVLKLNLKIIEYGKITTSGLQKKLIIPFATYYNDPRKFDNLISTTVANSLKIPRNILLHRIKVVMDQSRFFI